MPSPLDARPDLCIVGGGIVGLWTAFYAARQGLDVLLLEKRSIGAGASGGLLGALMPHQPTGWNDKKQFQLDGLMSLEAEVAGLEATTGMTTGYRRCGRLMPIRHPEKKRQSAQWAEASRDHWPAGQGWEVLEESSAPGWLPAAECPHGVNHDTLSARIDPRGLLDALAADLATRSNVRIREHTEVRAIDHGGNPVMADGTTITPGRTVLTAGWETFPLIAGKFTGEPGRGVKGQAALLQPAMPIDPGLPILYDNGVYVIAHENGHAAIGSTSENDFSDAKSTDTRLDDLISRATMLCPALENAAIVERWAGVRPRAPGREPLVGPLPGHPRLLVATGGFKITFAIAHLMARAVVAQAQHETPDRLPDLFRPENRLTRSA